MTLSSSAVVAPSPTSSTSSSATGTGSSAAVNASRLRENQRRSRARKKEYLMSLETRFQACQRTGIEANIEIQNAAKRVVRENKQLRAMLNRRGVTDAEIDKVLKDGGEENEVEGETPVEGVLKALERRPCGEPTAGSDSMQCKPSRPCERQRVSNERRNSTGMMVAARGAERGGGRGTVNGGAPALTVATSKLASPPLLSPHQDSSSYPTPTSTPAASSVPGYTIPASTAQVNDYYNYSMPSSQPRQCCTSPAVSSQSPAYNLYQMSPTAPTPSNNSCCPQPQSSFYPTTQSQCSTSMAASSPCGYPAQRPMYVTTLSPSYQTPSPILSTTPCHLAQSYINQLHPGLPDEKTSNLINEICPPHMLGNSQCHVDNALLFGVLDRI